MSRLATLAGPPASRHAPAATRPGSPARNVAVDSSSDEERRLFGPDAVFLSLFGIAVYRRAHGVRPSATLISSARPNFLLRVKSVIGVNGVPPRRRSVNTPATSLPPTGPSLVGMPSGDAPLPGLVKDVTWASDRM